MEAAPSGRPRVGILSTQHRIDRTLLAAALLPLALVGYLGIDGGGYDVIVRSQVGIAIWWLLLVLFGFRLVRARLSTAGWVYLGLLMAYAVWTALSLLWTQSSESTMTDVSQLLLYVGVALVMLLVQGREAARYMLHGLGVAIVAIAVIALLSRLHFSWFPVPAVNALPGAARRLSYPLNYWNALAALMAIGVPVLLYTACAARAFVTRAVAGGCLPLLALCAFLTASRGGVIEVAVGVVVFLALAPQRLSKLAIMLCAGAGSALLIALANERSAVREGFRSTLAARQGNQLIAIAIAIVGGVALLVALIAVVEPRVSGPRMFAVSRRQMTIAVACCLVAAVFVFLIAGGPGFLNREWTQFKSAGGPTSGSQASALQRLDSVAGEGRYQYWQAAFHAANLKPLTGTGAGTFQFWWLAHGTAAAGFVVDAHSLYFQALGELGYPGFVIITSFIAWILGFAVFRVIRSRDRAQRLAIAAAGGGAFAFAFSAAIDWIWFIPVLPATLFVLAAVIFAPGDPRGDRPEPRTRRPAGPTMASRLSSGASRLTVVLASLAAIVVIALPMAATAAVRESQTLSRRGDLSAAFADAAQAVRVEPYAATPWLQEALVREQAGDLTGALVDAKAATSRESTNWSTWLVLSRIEARSGHAAAALSDFEHSRSLNPHSPIFTTGS